MTRLETLLKKLREAAEKTTPKIWEEASYYGSMGDMPDDDAEFLDVANPKTILALCECLERLTEATDSEQLADSILEKAGIE